MQACINYYTFFPELSGFTIATARQCLFQKSSVPLRTAEKTINVMTSNELILLTFEIIPSDLFRNFALHFAELIKQRPRVLQDG